MYRKLIFLITFVLLLSLTGTVSAIPFDTANAVWNFHTSDPTADENGPIYTNLSTYYMYYSEVEVTGGEAGEHWDGWAAPGNAWYSPMYSDQPEAEDIKPVGGVTFLARIRLGDLSPIRNVVVGMYDGGCNYSGYPSYGIEVHSGEPVFVITEAGMEGVERTELALGKVVEADTWYDYSGVFDPTGNKMTLTVMAVGGSLLGQVSKTVTFNELYYSDSVEWEIFCSPCYAYGYSEGEGEMELAAVWIGAQDVLIPAIVVSNPQPPSGATGVHCDVDELSFYPPIAYVKIQDPPDPCADPCLLGPLDYSVYFGDDPCKQNMDLIAEFFGHDTNGPCTVDVPIILYPG